jgi:hypothetical protein
MYLVGKPENSLKMRAVVGRIALQCIESKYTPSVTGARVPRHQLVTYAVTSSLEES